MLPMFIHLKLELTQLFHYHLSTIVYLNKDFELLSFLAGDSQYYILHNANFFPKLLWQIPRKYFGNKDSRLQLYYSYQISCYAGKDQVLELSSIENFYSRIQLLELFLESSNCDWILYNVSHIQGAVAKFF